MTQKVDYSKLQFDYLNEELPYGHKAPKEDLQYLYVDLGLNVFDIGEIMNKGKSTIERWISFYGIKRDTSKNIPKEDLTERVLNMIDWSRMSRNFVEQPWKHGDKPIRSDFKYLYLELNLSTYEIAALLGRTRNYVQIILSKLNLYKNTYDIQQNREQRNLQRTGTRFPNVSPEVVARRKGELK